MHCSSLTPCLTCDVQEVDAQLQANLSAQRDRSLVAQDVGKAVQALQAEEQGRRWLQLGAALPLHTAH